MYYIVGLGNPGEEYDNTRHNTGRIALFAFARKNNFSDFEFNKKMNAEVAEGKVGKEKVVAIAPDTFMNKSGHAVSYVIKSAKAAGNLVVIHDDLDIPFGKFKISFNKSSGGHKGVESIMRVLKTEAFVRVRVGISPTNLKGIAKKPQGEEVVSKFILGKFKPAEEVTLKKVAKNVSRALVTVIAEGRERAMGEWNSQ